MPHRDSIGSSSLVGDFRWSGTFGVNLDYVARSHCSVEIIHLKDIEVLGILASDNESISWRRTRTWKHSDILQEILEKFEFFPIKCRIQRATQIWSQCRNQIQNSVPYAERQNHKTKVSDLVVLQFEIAFKLDVKISIQVFFILICIFCISRSRLKKRDSLFWMIWIRS